MEHETTTPGTGADQLFTEVERLLEEKLAEFRRENALTRDALSQVGGALRRFEGEVHKQAVIAYRQMKTADATLKRLKAEEAEIHEAGISLGNLNDLFNVYIKLFRKRSRSQKGTLAQKFIAKYVIGKMEEKAKRIYQKARFLHEGRFGKFDESMKIALESYDE